MQKKIKLSLEDLAVDSFTTAPAAGRTGTVNAHGTERNTWCGQNSCDGTCDNTQQGLCGGGESVGLSACCATANCTQDPYAADCYVSDVHCSQAEPCQFSQDFTCTC